MSQELFRSGAPLWIASSVWMYVCLSVCMYVGLSHLFWNPYILQLIHFTVILMKYKIFSIKKYDLSFFYSRLYFYINLVYNFIKYRPRYTFEDKLLKCKIFYIEKNSKIEFFICRICLLIIFFSLIFYFLFRSYGRFVLVIIYYIIYI